VKSAGDELSDYCVLDTPGEEYRLSQFERLTLVGGKELDRALDWIAKQITRFSCDGQLGALSQASIEEAIRFYGAAEWQLEPDRFFVPPCTPDNVKLVPIHGFKNGQVSDLQFESRYQLQNPAFESEYALYPETRTCYARLWQHRSAARGLLVAVHGWSMGDQKVNALALQPGYFFSLGFDVALIELPYHGRRAPEGKGNRQPLFPDGNIMRTNEAMAQAISDLRALKSYFGTRYEKVGVMGMSLGGYVSALWASLDPLDFAVLMVPMACMGDAAFEIMARQDKGIDQMLSLGLDRDKLQEVFRLHSPLIHQPKVPQTRRLIIAGLGDEVVSPRHPHLLWEHWERPKIHWFSGGHVAQMKNSSAFQEIGKFLEGVLPSSAKR
jgi:hypothetical protein